MDGQVCPGRVGGLPAAHLALPRQVGEGGVIWLLSSTYPLVLPTAMNKGPSFYLTPKAEHGYHKIDAHRRADL